MKNYLLYKTTPLLSGDMMLDIIVGNGSGSELLVENAQLRPISRLVPYAVCADQDILIRSHVFNIREFYEKTQSKFWASNIDPSLGSDWPYLIPDDTTDVENKYIKNWDDTYWAGTKRMNKSLYGKTHECLVPLYLEFAEAVEITLSITTFSGDQTLTKKTLTIERSELTSSEDATFHDRFCEYFCDYLDHVEIATGNQKIAGISYGNNTATLYGLSVASGNMTKFTDYSLTSNLISRERPLVEFNSIITNSFRDNKLIVPQLLNLNLCFSPEEIIQFQTRKLIGNTPQFCVDISVRCKKNGVWVDVDKADIFTNHHYVSRPFILPDSCIGETYFVHPSENALDYLEDNTVSDIMHVNKITQPICHWCVASNPSTLFNLYDGFGAYATDADDVLTGSTLTVLLDYGTAWEGTIDELHELEEEELETWKKGPWVVDIEPDGTASVHLNTSQFYLAETLLYTIVSDSVWTQTDEVDTSTSVTKIKAFVDSEGDLDTWLSEVWANISTSNIGQTVIVISNYGCYTDISTSSQSELKSKFFSITSLEKGCWVIERNTFSIKIYSSENEYVYFAEDEGIYYIGGSWYWVTTTSTSGNSYESAHAYYPITNEENYTDALKTILDEIYSSYIPKADRLLSQWNVTDYYSHSIGITPDPKTTTVDKVLKNYLWAGDVVLSNQQIMNIFVGDRNLNKTESGNYITYSEKDNYVNQTITSNIFKPLSGYVGSYKFEYTSQEYDEVYICVARTTGIFSLSDIGLENSYYEAYNIYAQELEDSSGVFLISREADITDEDNTQKHVLLYMICAINEASNQNLRILLHANLVNTIRNLIQSTTESLALERLTILHDALITIQQPDCVYFNKSLSLTPDNTVSQKSGEQTYYKNNNANNWVFRYSDNIKPAIFTLAIERGDITYDYVAVDDDGNYTSNEVVVRENVLKFANSYGRNFLWQKTKIKGSDISSTSDFRLYAYTGVAPKYPSINYDCVNVYTDINNQYGDLVYDEPICNLLGLDQDGNMVEVGGWPEYKWFWKSTITILPDVFSFEVYTLDNNNDWVEEISFENLRDNLGKYEAGSMGISNYFDIPYLKEIYEITCDLISVEVCYVDDVDANTWNGLKKNYGMSKSEIIDHFAVNSKLTQFKYNILIKIK